MMAFWAANAATVLVGPAVLAAAALIVRGLLRDKRAGKSRGGGHCTGRPSCQACHVHKE